MTCYYSRHWGKRAKHGDMGGFFLMIPSNLSSPWLVQGGPTTGERGPAHTHTQGCLHMALPSASTAHWWPQTKQTQACCCWWLEPPSNVYPTRAGNLSFSLMGHECLKQYPAHSRALYLFAKQVNDGAILLKLWLAGLASTRDILTFLGQTKTCSANPRCDPGCGGMGGTRACAQGSKQENGKTPPWGRGHLAAQPCAMNTQTQKRARPFLEQATLGPPCPCTNTATCFSQTVLWEYLSFSGATALAVSFEQWLH